MSHHFDSPTGREDPRLNLCDLFVFAGPDETTVLVMTVNPDAGLSSPTELREEGLYEFKIDTDGDAREDVSFRLVVTNGSCPRRIERFGDPSDDISAPNSELVAILEFKGAEASLTISLVDS
jgi:hypothetical protein